MSSIPLVVKLEIILDNEQRRYFPGDAIHGKIFVTANQSHTLRHFRLAWTGRIHVEPIQSNKDKYTYFNECWKLGPTLIKSSTKAQNGNISVPCYTTELVLATTVSEEFKVELQKNETIALAFTVHVPNDRPLPSCTESMNVFSDKIIYMLAAFVVNAKVKQKFFAKRVVPVFEAVYTKTPDMIASQTAEQVFRVSLFSEKLTCVAAMRMTLPLRGCLPGVDIPVSITIWNNMEFTRMQTISISLFRVKQVLANGRIYIFDHQESKSIITNLKSTTSDTNNNNQREQTAHVKLRIPRDIIPTIALEQSRLLGISYFIQAKVLEQDGIYITADGKQLEFMMVDLPFTIGTISTPSSSSSSPTPISFPPVAYQQLTKTLPRISSPPVASSSSASIHHQFTVSSATVNERQRYSQASFQTLRNDERRNDKTNSAFSPSKVHDRNSRSENQEEDDDTTYVKQAKQVSPAMVMISKLPPIDVSFNIAFDTFAGDDLDDTKEAEPEMKPAVSSEIKTEEDRVFKMFPDDDDDESDYDPDAVQPQTASSSKYINRKEAVFKMFRDEDSDEDSDDEDVTIVKDKPQQLLDAVTVTMESSALGRQQNIQSNVFKMFNDDSSSEEAVIEVPQMAGKDTRVKPHHDETKHHKPNEFIIEYKPDTKDTTNHINAQTA